MFVENGVLVEKKYVDDDFDQFSKNKQEKWYPKNITEYFFYDQSGVLTINDSKIFECYGQYTETLRMIYDNIKIIYTKLASKTLDEEDLSEIDFPRIPNDIKLKGLDYFLDHELKERLLSPRRAKF